MPNMSSPIAPRQPAPDVAERVREILPLIAANSERCERERSVPAENMDLISDAGLFRMLQPHRYGGLERTPQEFFAAVAAIGGACTSTGWVAGVLGEHQFVVAHFSEAAQDDVWGKDPDSVVVATADPSRGTAVAVDGGYVIDGTWSFSSGAGFGRWHVVGAALAASDGEPTKRALFLIPATDVTYLDTWNVSGLRGTGSNDATVRDCFVPAHRMLDLRDVMALRTPGMLVNRSPLFRIPVFTVIALGILAPVVGATQSVVRNFIVAMRSDERGGGIVGTSSKSAESPVLQKLAAEASGLMAAVSALIENGLRDTWEAALAGTVDVDRRVLSRRDYALAVRLCVQTMNALYEASGARALYLPNAIERVWRDVHAAAKHHGLNWDSMGTMSGRYLAGLDPKGQF